MAERDCPWSRLYNDFMRKKALPAAKRSSQAEVPHLAASRPRPSYLKVQTKRAFEDVAAQIRAQLASGALSPGDRLPSERELAEQFQLSRNTVREALRSLEMAGVLEFRKGMYGGAFVRQAHGDAVVAGFADLFRMGMFTPQHLRDARLLVSVATTRAACELATSEDLAKLQQNLDASEAAVARGDTDERVRLGLEFHRLIGQASGNPIMAILIDALMTIQLDLIQVLGPSPDKLIMPSRRKILKYITARDSDKAAAEMERNISALHARYLNGKDQKKMRAQRATVATATQPASAV